MPGLGASRAESSAGGHGLQLVTRFSGLDAPGSAAASIAQALQMRDGTGSMRLRVSVFSACDRDSRALACLKESQPRAQHLFKDVMDFASEECQRTMADVMKRYQGKHAGSEDEKFQFMRELIEPLLHGGGLKTTSTCEHHGDECPLAPPRGQGFTLNCTGTPCTDWSRRGKQEKSFGRTAAFFAIWIAELLSSGVPLALHECTEDFEDSGAAFDCC